MPITPLENLTYDKVWTNSSDFPTVENSEAQVRADLQYHPDAVRTFLNNNLIIKLTNNFNHIVNSVASWFPKASTSQLGAVKVGTGLGGDENGVLSVKVASTSQLGAVKVGAGLSVDENGVLCAELADAADYVVAQGSGDGWRWQKWYSGKAELWYYGSVTTHGNTHYAGSTLYYTDSVYLATPFKVLNGVVVGNCAHAGEYISNTESSWSNQRISFRLYRNDGIPEGSEVQIMLHVMGDWG